MNKFTWSHTATPEHITEMEREDAKRSAEIKRVATGMGRAIANRTERQAISALVHHLPRRLRRGKK